MEYNLQDAVAWMVEHGYLVAVKGNFKVTAKFNQEMKGKAIGLVVTPSKSLVAERGVVLADVKTESQWADLYMQFIIDAEIPTRCEGADGHLYDINKYSVGAMKAFRSILTNGNARYEILVKSTMLYYRTHRKFAVKIGNYIEDGAWRSDYAALLSAADEGGDALTTHIQSEINAGQEFNRFKRG